MADRRWIFLVSAVYVGALLLPAMASGAAPTPNVLWWKFDEGSGTVAKDSSGNGRDGTIAGAQWQAGGAGDLAYCLNFNTTNSTVINVGAGTSLNGLSALTVSMWVKSRITNTDKGFINCETPDGADNFVTMRYDAAGSLYQGTNILKMALTTTAGELQLESSSGLQTTEWQHVTMMWASGSPIRFYSNGVLNTPTGQSAANTGTISGCTTLIVGKGGKDTGGSWDGLIDDVRIYDYALTDTQVASLLSFKPPETATLPSPADKATNVLRDVVLGWVAAETAQKHDVYLDADAADVNNASIAAPLDALASQGQTETTFAPTGLQYGQTYYWRVDEVSAPPDSTVVKGDLWSFTVEPYAYPITGVTATASGSQVGMGGPEKTVDGSGLNTNDQHSTDDKQMWLSAGAQPGWIQYEFDKVYKLHELWVWNQNQLLEGLVGFGAKSVKIEHSLDGSVWTELAGAPEFAQGTGVDTYAHNTTVDFGGISAKYVKLTINTSWGGVTQSGLSEVRFFYVPIQAREPQPATATTGVAVDTTLNWQPGREAASHKVYFGTDVNAVTSGTASAQTITDHSFIPAGLEYGRTYYWRVDEVNEAIIPNTYEGSVWSFTTQEYEVVDDFESYTDNEDSRIYEFWIDGYADKSSGSTVGHLDAPFAEQMIIHGDTQSMPLFYDNSSSFSSSEATLTFDSPQNWTANGVKSLSLFFRGAVDNGGQLYLKINNTKVPYNGDAAHIAKPVWLRWNVDLSTVGGNLSKVPSLTIGIEGAGSKGIVYIDDIRLYPTVAAPAGPPVITGVARANGQSGTRTDASPLTTFTDSTAPVFMAGGLQDGAYIFSDRPYPWVNTPAELVGADYVLTFNNDKNAGETDVTYTVTLSQAATVFLTCDDRITDQQAAVDLVVAAFATPGQFKNTGLKIYIRENATTDRPMSVFAADLPAGTYVFGAQDSGRNFYTIAAMGK